MPNNVDKRNSSAYTVNNLKAEQVRAIVREAGVTKTKGSTAERRAKAAKVKAKAKANAKRKIKAKPKARPKAKPRAKPTKRK